MASYIYSKIHSAFPSVKQKLSVHTYGMNVTDVAVDIRADKRPLESIYYLFVMILVLERQ